MIIISRKENESIVIDDDVTVTVMEIHADEVRLGIDHPPDVSVHRGEAFGAIRHPAEHPEHPK